MNPNIKANKADANLKLAFLPSLHCKDRDTASKFKKKSMKTKTNIPDLKNRSKIVEAVSALISFPPIISFDDNPVLLILILYYSFFL